MTQTEDREFQDAYDSLTEAQQLIYKTLQDMMLEIDSDAGVAVPSHKVAMTLIKYAAIL